MASDGERNMRMNVGPVDRVVRLAIGFLLISYAAPRGLAPADWNWLGWIGVVPLLTAVFGFSPLYALLGRSTWPAKRVA